MKFPHVSSIATLSLLLGACDAVDDTSTGEQAVVNQQGVNLQGVNLQGVNLQGVNLQGVNLQGFKLDGVTQFDQLTLRDEVLDNVHVEHGEIVASHGQVTLHGAALVGAHFLAEVRNTNVT